MSARAGRIDRAAAAASFDAAPIAGEEEAGDDRFGGGGDGPFDGSSIYDGCPVTPLGTDNGAYFYLDVIDQLRCLTRHDQEAITSLFGGRDDELRRAWPRFGKPKPDGSATITGFDAVTARATLMRACTDRGVWHSTNRVRGVGAWASEAGGAPPILHCGDAVMIGRTLHPPGMIDGYVYPSDLRQPRPHPDPQSAHGGPGWELLEVLETWRLANGPTDARLLLGWLGAAMFGGALDWRPMLWVTAEANSGKSTLNKLMIAVLGGDSAVVQSTDPTEAGLRQHLKLSARPVLLDEIESEAENRRTQAIIKLARQAASGGVVLRGGQDHQGQEFKARSAFMFSSILIPSLLDQDISRLAVIDLKAFAGDAIAPRIDLRRWALAGRRLRRLIYDQWHRWHETLEGYRGALARVGHSSRGCDQFGTLLAMADLMLHQHAPDAAGLEEAVAAVTAERVAQRFGSAPDWERCLMYLVSQQMQRRFRDRQLTVGEMVAAAADLTDGDPCSPVEADRELARVGLRVLGRGERATLAVANVHDGLRRLFEATRWQTERGQTGVWTQSLRRAPGAAAAGNSLGFARSTSRAWLIPVRLAISTERVEAEPGSVITDDMRELR